MNPAIGHSQAFAQFVSDMIRDMMKPRRICICDDFRNTGKMEMDWHKCECGGWMSSLRIVENKT